ncbi:MAG: dihydrodipicolinate reductase [Deltaproteobacteria bacterium]|nr:dihydrodipicolinate reductase [Deltaproteobacteria bacterium]MBW2418876.1 dihydrodipicolinate reductase [Deltaproteobacteria bacterium]
MTFKVIQWATGKVGQRAARAIIEHPNLELVGVHAFSPDKVGKDAGALCGTDETGVLATDDVDELLALGADCVSYTPLLPNADELERILEAGINVVSTAGFLTGRNVMGNLHERIDRAARKGGASIFGSGINPGFMNQFAVMLTGVCDRVHSLSVTESADVSTYDSPGIWKMLGWGQPVGAEGQNFHVESVSEFFLDALDSMAEALGLVLDEKRTVVEYSVARDDIELPFMTFPKGTVAGQRSTWHGMAGGRPVISLRIVWQMGGDLDPGWPLGEGYRIEVEGEPAISARFELKQPAHAELSRESHGMGLAWIATAMPAVNAIPAVCRAAPGVCSYLDLPPIRATDLVQLA